MAWLGALVLGTIWLVLFASALASRLPYPYDLEWMEGGMLAHALHWRDLYGPPRLDFVPFVYPPGYPALLALFGPSPWVGRLLSLTGSLVAAGCLAWMLRGPTGLAAAVCFLTTWSAGGAFFDLARPDGVFLGLMALGVALEWHERDGSVPLVLAFFVKQAAVFFLPALWIAAAARGGWRQGLRRVATTAVPVWLGLGVLQLASDGYAWTYLFQVPASHPVVWGRMFPLAWLELGAALPVLAFGAAVAAATRTRAEVELALPVVLAVALTAAALVLAPMLAWPEQLQRGIGLGALIVVAGTGWLATAWRDRFLVALAVGGLVGAVWMRAHHGGFLNVLLPAFWVLALGTGRLLASRSWAPWVFALQLGLGLATPFEALTPTPRDREAGDALVARLKQVDGPVWSPYAVWLPTYAGHAPQAHLIAVWDLDHPTGPLYPEVQQFRDAMRSHHWGAVVTSGNKLGFGLERSYRLRNRLHNPDGALRPRSGWPVQLTGVWVPRSSR